MPAGSSARSLRYCTIIGVSGILTGFDASVAGVLSSFGPNSIIVFKFPVGVRTGESTAFPVSVNLAASSATYNVMVWSTGTLAAGAHKVRILRTGSGSLNLTLDAVDIWGTISN